MFEKIRDMLENPNMLVCLLIDEVESLVHARTQCMSGNEPSDSIRVVNAVLTQIDQVKNYRNILILTTSNMMDVIDVAFVSRADIKLYLALPSVMAVYEIYRSCILELMRVGHIVKMLQIHIKNVLNSLSTCRDVYSFQV